MKQPIFWKITFTTIANKWSQLAAAGIYQLEDAQNKRHYGSWSCIQATCLSYLQKAKRILRPLAWLTQRLASHIKAIGLEHPQG